ncbi:MAG: TIGR03960 family B12-binding radical SAM protein [Desulfonatronovibrionaceae bacterium]
MKELIPSFPRPSHYLGNEVNAVHKDPAEVCLRIALAFPDVYEIGMSYCGQKILYNLLNREKEFWAERVFAPSTEAASVMRLSRAPLASLESDTPLTALDLVAFSLTHELCYTNVLYMLDLAGIPLEAAHREHTFPLVAAGGGAVFNAEPVAEFFDFMVLGDGEQTLPETAHVLCRAKEEGASKWDVLARLSSLPGVYVPSFFAPDASGSLRALYPGYTRVEKAVVPDLNDCPFPEEQVVPFGRPVHDRLSVEVARGCTRGCRFCHAGMTYRPVRERSQDKLLALVEAGLNRTGFEELSFLSLSTGDYSRLNHLFHAVYERCTREQVSLALPSLRAGSVNEDLMRLMASIRHTGATIAPEAGTVRLRKVINKGIEEEELLTHTAKLFALGWNSIKLYFMLGLPTEQKEDLDGILETCRRVRESAGSRSGRVHITASISPFVPKTHTPFQWEGQLGPEEAKERLAYLQEITKPFKWLSLKWQDPEMSTLEGVFSRGGRELALVLQEAFQRGLFFSSWSDCLRFKDWLALFSECGLRVMDYLRPREPEEELPWDHLLSGVSKSFLLAERRRAYQEVVTPDCRDSGCSGCGVCNLRDRSSLLSGQAEHMRIEPVFAPQIPEEDMSGAGPEQEADPSCKGAHVRIWYSKTRECRWLSQLEMQKVLDRAMRRASLPVTFSQGFHPLPLFSFGRAVPVGVESLSEWVNVFFRRGLEEKEILPAVNENLPSGLKMYHMEALTIGKRQSQPLGERYKIEFYPFLTRALEEDWQVFVSSPCFRVQKQGKKKIRNVDLRPLVRGYELNGSELVLDFDWSEEYISPLFFLQSVFKGFSLQKARVVKTEQFFVLEGSLHSKLQANQECKEEKG